MGHTRPSAGRARPSGSPARVGHYYDSAPPSRQEAARLERHSPVEYAMTLRLLEPHTRRRGRAADIGVGAGHYADWLAARGWDLHLVDVSRRMLDLTRRRLERAGSTGRIAGVHRASATDLAAIPSRTLDLVLMLGPLYHLVDIADRRRAVREAHRVLKPGGLLFAAGINRLAYLRDLFRGVLRMPANEVLKRRAFHGRYLRDGLLDPVHAPPIGHSHLTTVNEFERLFRTRFRRVRLIGTESFTSAWQARLRTLSRREREAWLDLVAATGETPEGLAQSDHFLFIGRRSTR